MNNTKLLPSPARKDGSLKELNPFAYTPKNFHRMFYNQAIPLFNALANKPTKILLYFLANADSDNRIICTYENIMKSCGIKDRSTVAATLKKLEEMQAIVKVSTSIYMLNPAVALKGNNQKYGNLAFDFNDFLKQRKKTAQQTEERN